MRSGLLFIVDRNVDSMVQKVVIAISLTFLLSTLIEYDAQRHLEHEYFMIEPNHESA